MDLAQSMHGLRSFDARILAFRSVFISLDCTTKLLNSNNYMCQFQTVWYSLVQYVIYFNILPRHLPDNSLELPCSLLCTLPHAERRTSFAGFFLSLSTFLSTSGKLLFALSISCGLPSQITQDSRALRAVFFHKYELQMFVSYLIVFYAVGVACFF